MAFGDRLLASLGFTRLTLEHARAGQSFSTSNIVGREQVPGWAVPTLNDDGIDAQPRVTRRQALAVPAVKRGRDLIAGTCGAITYYVADALHERGDMPLLAQPERSVARSVTLARTFEDLLLEGASWWRVTERDYRGYPVHVARLEPGTVRQQVDGRVYYAANGLTQGTQWVYVEDRDLIRFDSPNDPVLEAGAGPIRTHLRLASATDRYARDPVPAGYFAPKDDVDIDPDEVSTFLDDWAAARRARTTGYVPAVVAYHSVTIDPEKLQMAETRTQAVLELARVMGVDPEDLGVSTTSRTYQNSQERHLARINETYGPYVQAFTERLSMADVTPRGYVVRADWSSYLRADDLTRFTAYEKALALGITDRDQILARESLPEPNAPTAAVPAPSPVEASMTAPSATFDAAPALFGFDTEETRLGFEVDTEARTIYGLAVPWGAVAVKDGQRYQFSRGSLKWGTDVGRVKLLMQHDRASAVGRAVELTEDNTGLWAKFKVARGAEGDRALALAEDGVWDGLSIGIGQGPTFSKRGGIHHAVSAPLAEISLTPSPAFDDARVSVVAASADDPTKGNTVVDTTNADAQVSASAPAFDMDALATALAAKLTPAADGPEVIAPSTGRAFVAEALPYTFDRGGNLAPVGDHDFSSDLISAVRHGDLDMTGTDAGRRVAALLQFATVTTDVNETNPTINRPDMFVDQRDYRYPLWESVNKGAPPNGVQPFMFPKFNSASGLVGAHTEGTEPTPGAYTTTSQTVTPSAISGKASITREVWDMGGNPAVSNLIFGQMLRSWREALEAATSTFLATLTAATDIALTTAAVDDALAGEWDAAVAELAFARGYDFDMFAVEKVLYKTFVAAVDADGRPLFARIGSTNANGQARGRFTSLDLSGVEAVPSWALASTAGASNSSWLFDRAVIHGWATAPQRLEFAGTAADGTYAPVAMVDLAIWGYRAFANSDIGGVRQVTYDNAA